jgi:hypothetical protein
LLDQAQIDGGWVLPQSLSSMHLSWHVWQTVRDRRLPGQVPVPDGEQARFGPQSASVWHWAVMQ